jgi:flagellar protein FlbD
MEREMIALHKLNGSLVTINADLIETIEATPDTVISLSSGNRFVVRENVEEVVARVIEYQRKINVPKQEPVEKKPTG